MQPITLDFSIVRGDTFEETIQFLEGEIPANIVDWTLVSQMRLTADAVEFTTLSITKFPDGIITIGLPVAITETLLGKYVYDIERTTLDAKVRTLVKGTITVSADITRVV